MRCAAAALGSTCTPHPPCLACFPSDDARDQNPAVGCASQPCLIGRFSHTSLNAQQAGSPGRPGPQDLARLLPGPAPLPPLPPLPPPPPPMVVSAWSPARFSTHLKYAHLPCGLGPSGRAQPKNQRPAAGSASRAQISKGSGGPTAAETGCSAARQSKQDRIWVPQAGNASRASCAAAHCCLVPAVPAAAAAAAAGASSTHRGWRRSCSLAS